MNKRELVAYFRSEFRRLAMGELSGPIAYPAAPAASPARPTYAGTMAPPACLCTADSEAGRLRAVADWPQPWPLPEKLTLLRGLHSDLLNLIAE